MKRSLIVLLILICITSVFGAETKETGKEKAVQPTHYGKVLGHVYDTEKQLPITNASVSMAVDGVFLDTGKTISLTDVYGGYKCEAMLGRVSSNFDLGRALLSSWIGLLMGSATNTTKRIDVSRLTVRVTCEGYKPFEGTVLCRSVDAAGFAVNLEPILLAPEDSRNVSTAANGWGPVKIQSAYFEPAIAKPNDKVTLIVRLTSPGVPKEKDLAFDCKDPWSGKILKMKYSLTDDGIEFKREFTVPKNSESGAYDTSVLMVKCPYEVLNIFFAYATVHIYTDYQSFQTSQLRYEITQLEKEDQIIDAVAKLNQLAVQPDVTDNDLYRLNALSVRIKDTDSRVLSAKMLMERANDKNIVYPTTLYAQALVANNQPSYAIDVCLPITMIIPPNEKPEKIPKALMLALGQAYLMAGEYDKAQNISVQLLKYSYSTEEVTQFRVDLNLAQTADAMKQDPNPTSLSDYARALASSGRWEESVGYYQKALEQDPTMDAVKRDYWYTISHLPGQTQNQYVTLDEAIASAERQAGGLDAKIKSKDFFAWHTLGILLYCKALQQQESNNPDIAETWTYCRNVILEALKCGRKGSVVNTGTFSSQFGWIGSKSTNYSGFAYGEADIDFALLEGMEILAKNPDNYIAHYNVAQSLYELGHYTLADNAINRCLSIMPIFADAKYVKALILSKLDDKSNAISYLEQVVSVNPIHPKANIELAELYTEDGNTSDAVDCLATHAKFYGVYDKNR